MYIDYNILFVIIIITHAVFGCTSALLNGSLSDPYLQNSPGRSEALLTNKALRRRRSAKNVVKGYNVPKDDTVTDDREHQQILSHQSCLS